LTILNGSDQIVAGRQRPPGVADRVVRGGGDTAGVVTVDEELGAGPHTDVVALGNRSGGE